MNRFLRDFMKTRYSWDFSSFPDHGKMEETGSVMLAHAISCCLRSCCAMFSASCLVGVVTITMMYGFCSVFTLNYRVVGFLKAFALSWFFGFGRINTFKVA